MRGATMSLRESPTMTPARIEANRRNARKSTGPRTKRGKAQVRFNALKTGDHSRLYQDFRMYLLFLPPCEVLGKRKFLDPEMARHRLFSEALENAIWAETQTCLLNRELNSRTALRRGD
jgi:hypothetical protein